MVSKKWLVTPPAALEHLKKYRGISPILAQVLFNRGFEEPQEANDFLYAKDVTHNPLKLVDMSKAVDRIRSAIKSREKIVVYGDFDADGVTSTTLLVQSLRTFGANVEPYIPNRVEEGYGLNSPALKQLHDDGAKLVITVDCGIRSVEEVREASEYGLDIVITDHHSLGPELPPAYAVVNPKRGDYPEDMLAGVGVAFKLVQALIMAARRNGGAIREPEIEDLLDLVAIGTVADMMPLDRLENRILVRRGLEMLNQARRPGVRALLDVAGVKPGEVSATTIGFVIGPRINAAGRLDDAMRAVELLCAETDAEARQLALELHDLNTERQEKTRKAQAIIQEELEDRDEEIPLIFASNEGFEPGIVGLVAGRLTEQYFRPAVVMEKGETESRASCRSIPQFDITRALDQCADLLVRHGGHDLAAGFTVMNENVELLREKLTVLAQNTLAGQTLSPTLHIDAKLDLPQLTEELVTELQLLEPCGNGNPQPVFMIENAHVAEHRTVGKDGLHLKLRISRPGQPPLDAIGFGLGHWAENMPDRIDFAFQLEVNEWNGRRSLQAKLQDIRPTGED